MLYVIGASTTRTDEAARARVAPSMAFDADSANNREAYRGALRGRVKRGFPVPMALDCSERPPTAGGPGVWETALPCGFGSLTRHSQTRHTSLTAAAVNRLWRATRVPHNYRPGFIVAQGP